MPSGLFEQIAWFALIRISAGELPSMAQLFRMVREIIETGQERGEIRSDMDAFTLAQHILLLERGILINWCVRSGEFSLGGKGHDDFKLYTSFLGKQQENVN